MILAFGLNGCSSAPSSATEPSSTNHAQGQANAQRHEFTPVPLTKEEAANRFKQIAHVTYGLWFGLEGEHPDYEGRAVVNFDLKPKAKEHGKSLFVDFSNGTIRSIVLNGTTLQDIDSHDRYDGNRIHFRLSELQPGPNRVEIAFMHNYSHNGHGLHRFKDPVDHAVYLYSDLEPFFAHNIFPCFDQPDLKAAFELTVETPPKWQVVSNTLEREVSNVDGRKSWAFPPTPLLSPYVFALIAGEYTQWKADAEGIPMRLFARKSLRKYVDFKEWFDITRKGLNFYTVQFGYPYPYSKYDQILVPEFDEGAMENAGAVTLTERYVYRTRVTRQARERRADTILHEMAHMWFGDLVTMKWWNGLWLNESFATFMSTWNLSDTTPISGMNKNTAWEEFFAGDKQWAYWQDQLVTTHPIDLPVPNTDHAFSNFDGITYGKGASVIKQLRYYLGEDDFREGIQRYFQRYALRNTTLAEFIQMLSEASGKNLIPWQEAWLTTSGVNTVKADWACDAEGKISKMTLIQAKDEASQILRPHRTELGLYSFPKKGSGKLQLKESIPVIYSQAETPVPSAIGKACPDLVYPNTNDYDYVKVELDPASLRQAASHLSHVDSTLTRQMLWHSLWEMVVDGKLAPKSYLRVALKNLPSEKDNLVLDRLIKSIVNVKLDRESIAGFMSDQERKQYLPEFEALSLKELKSSAPGTDSQLLWLRAFLESASTPSALTYVRGLLSGKTKISGLKIDQEVRWALVSTLARNGASDAEALINKEYAADPTDMGKKAFLAAQVQIPDLKHKSEWMNKIIAAAPTGAAEGLSGMDLRTLMSYFTVLGQERLNEGFVDRYFTELQKVAKSPDEEFVDHYTAGFYPKICSQKVIDLTTEALKSNDLPAYAIKNLKVNRQEQERCLRARQTKAEI
jgi:aminopeptidase N